MDPASTIPAHAAGRCNGPEVIVAEPGWHRFVPDAARVARRAARAAPTRSPSPCGRGPGGGVGAPTILLANDRIVRRLNARDRGRDKPTNVLTYDPPAPGLPGQIVLALGVVRREARTHGKRPAHHLAHLVLHGALHLAGHDHRRAGDARRMEMTEARLLHRLGVPNPWRQA